MYATLRKLTLIATLVTAGQASAATITLENAFWRVSIESEDFVMLGTPQLEGNAVTFHPGFELSAPIDQIHYLDSRNFSLNLGFVAKPNYRITGYDVQASGTTQVGSDAHLGISGSFNKSFSGAFYADGTLTGDGTWQDGFSQSPVVPLAINGSLFVETTNHFSFERAVGSSVTEVYEYFTDYAFVGYKPVYDAEGNFLYDEEVYELQQFQRVVDYIIEPIYATFYDTSGAAITLDELRIGVGVRFAPVDVDGQVVPVPPAALLLASGLVGLLATRRPRQRSAA